MNPYTVVLFGEAEKGQFQTAYYFQSIVQLSEYLGNPPPNSRGLHCAVQALLYQRNLVFFRVKEEGFSCSDYLSGLQVLENQQTFSPISALCIPGVGDANIIHAMSSFCIQHHSIMITSQSDLYDYLTCNE